MSEVEKTKPVKAAKAVRLRLSPAMLRRVEAAAYCGLSVSEWDRMTAIGYNPEPVRVHDSKKIVSWSRHELAEWCKRRLPPREEWAPIWKAILARR